MKRKINKKQADQSELRPRLVNKIVGREDEERENEFKLRINETAKTRTKND